MNSSFMDLLNTAFTINPDAILDEASYGRIILGKENEQVKIVEL